MNAANTRRRDDGKIHSLRKTFQEGKAEAGLVPPGKLGRNQSRDPEADQQQSLQQKESTGLEAEGAAGILCFFRFFKEICKTY
ncbi:MAG: hypothetical protein ACI3V4_04400 [Faecousia sp.]